MPIAPPDGPPCPDCGAKMRMMLNQYLCDNMCEKPEVQAKREADRVAVQQARWRIYKGSYPNQVWTIN